MTVICRYLPSTTTHACPDLGRADEQGEVSGICTWLVSVGTPQILGSHELSLVLLCVRRETPSGMSSEEVSGGWSGDGAVLWPSDRLCTRRGSCQETPGSSLVADLPAAFCFGGALQDFSRDRQEIEIALHLCWLTILLQS